jgi:hypothetical protein
MIKEKNQIDEERYDLMRKGKKFGIIQVIQIVLSIAMLAAIYIYLVAYREAFVIASIYTGIIIIIFSYIAYRLFK